MFQAQLKKFIKPYETGGFVGAIEGPNFFLVLSTQTELKQEEGENVLESIRENIVKEKINRLNQFEEFINKEIKKNNLPADFSLAAGIVVGDIIYLKTVNKGKIFLQRKNKLAKLIDGNQTASGYLKEDDLFIFTTSELIEALNGETEFKKMIHKKDTQEVINYLSTLPTILSGVVSLFIKFLKPELIEKADKEMDLKEDYLTEKTGLGLGFKQRLADFYEKIKLSEYHRDKKKRTTLIIVFIIVLALIWSVGLGSIRRQENKINEKIKSTKELINQKLDQAEEVAVLNLSRSLVLISEAKNEVKKLKEQLGQKKEKEIAQLESLVNEKEKEIVKKEEKKYQEFYDLTIDNQKAQGNKFYLDKDNLSIIDNNQSIIYWLSLTKKSIDKVKDDQIKNASLVASYEEDRFFFVKDKGIYKIDDQKKVVKVIDRDKDWGEIIDLWVYNGNIYLLDKGKDEIYKYLVGDNGYSNKNSYFKSGESADLQSANSMAIDSSVYIGFKDYLLKYTAGVKDDFNTSFPLETININKIFTSQNTEKVYGWDKKSGSVYVLNKNGGYEREIKSSILSQASDFVVFENNIYILVKEKIYKISLD